MNKKSKKTEKKEKLYVCKHFEADCDDLSNSIGASLTKSIAENATSTECMQCSSVQDLNEVNAMDQQSLVNMILNMQKKSRSAYRKRKRSCMNLTCRKRKQRESFTRY